ncbi:TolC family outer membrane protein [Pseudohoeflea sp. DP4N28-3]|uniref:TolC family outer membrane protein n=2 Tax=Pseudohoeflea coraliihabitans TaxID=2860393 RepID=A0ABS6WQ49_9HYPH|nr:TolC family outer membrane protein [Pseudohoeflea sp. DP4N28-3]MBW3098106.1 TolC family outer membrane protein [Pseudohoeflea sp. DP4N28-3]
MAAVGLACSPAVASAESLYAAMARAYANNPDLNAARAGLRATDEGVAIAKSGYRPTVAAEGSVTITNRDGVTTDTASVGVSVTQTLFDGFQTRNNVRAAEATVFAGRENLRGTEIDILLAAAEAYANVNRDNQIVSFRRQNIAFLQEQFTAAQARFDVGESTRTDVSQAEAQLAGARALLTAAVAQAKASAAVYAQIVGTMPKNMKAAPLPTRLLPGSLDRAVAIGLKGHPSILAAKFSVDAAGFDVKAAEGTMLPGVSVTGSVNELEGGVTVGQVQARVSVPIYQGGAASARVRQAKELLGQQRIQVDSIHRAIEQAIISSWAQMEASRATINANRAQLRAANLALNGVVEERRVGQRTTLDVLVAQQSVLEARESLAQSERNAIVAAYSVLAYTGRLTVRRLGLQVAHYRPEEHYEATKDRWYGLRTPDGR